jgi:hypothetical protein
MLRNILIVLVLLVVGIPCTIEHIMLAILKLMPPPAGGAYV